MGGARREKGEVSIGVGGARREKGEVSIGGGRRGFQLV